MPPPPSNLPYVYNENNHNALENIKEGKKTDEISNSSCKTCIKRTQMHRSKPKKKKIVCFFPSFL